MPVSQQLLKVIAEQNIQIQKWLATVMENVTVKSTEVLNSKNISGISFDMFEDTIEDFNTYLKLKGFIL